MAGEVECTGTAPPKPYGHTTVEDELEGRLNDALRSGGISNTIGDIIVLENGMEPQRTHIAGWLLGELAAQLFHRPRSITFAMSIEAPRAVGDRRIQTRFFVCTLNFERFQQITAVTGLLSVLLVVAAIFIVTTSWYGESRKRRALQRAFEEVDQVMYGASAPYCRLDADDRIISCNLVMCRMLRMPEERASVDELRRHTLESLIAPSSKSVYQEAQSRRRAGQRVDTYELTFQHQRGSGWVKATVTGAAIPDSSTTSKRRQTFGVFVPQQHSSEVPGEPPDSVTGAA